jgi:hypothetical protein
MHCGSNRAASENAVRRSAHSHFPARSRAAHSDALAAIRANQVRERNQVRPPRQHPSGMLRRRRRPRRLKRRRRPSTSPMWLPSTRPSRIWISLAT